MNSSLFLTLPAFLVAIAVNFAEELPPASQREVDFAGDVQPLLQKHCAACHGQEKQESGLRLDMRDAALLGGDSGKAILAGESANSRLIQYVSGVDPDHLMPPEGPTLTRDEIGVLRAWIDRGANWPVSNSETEVKNNHWAYQAIPVVTPPNVKHGESIRNPIDQFIVSKLESLGLAPSPEADRYTLIRRLYLDLLGLLPTIEEVDAFVADSRPTAYEELVDRLLDSPHFGERWGRHWLDMARYADSDGYEKDNPRPDAYRWRDWVIDAINEDLPFDQFTIEQLAGDLLPDATDMQRLATAFHRQTLTNTEGGTDQEQFRVEACFDRTETTGAIWLGLTVGCARCHSHKYDAISQREYYQLFSFYNNGDEQTHVVPKSPSEIDAYQLAKAEHDAKVEALREKLRAVQSQLGTALAAWEAETKAQLATWTERPLQRKQLKPLSMSSDAEVSFKRQKDNSVLVSGNNPASVTYSIVAAANASFDTIRLDVLADKSLPAKGPGRVAHGNFVLSEFTVESSETEDFANPIALQFAAAAADHEQADKPWRATNAIDNDPATGWAIGPEYGKNHWAEFQLTQPLSDASSRFLRVRLSQQYGKQHTIGRFKLSVQTGSEPSIKVPENIVTILAIAANERTVRQQAELLEHYSRLDPSTKNLHEQIDALVKQEPAKPELTVRVLAQRTADPRVTYVLRRGEFLEPLTDAKVQASGIATLPPLQPRQQNSPADRLDLARWLVSTQNPLTPRVAVNHVWRILFGEGIVKTASDFGVRGDPPTHPELLDWLAAEFIGLNKPHAAAPQVAWSRKSLIKLIVMSATYRQSSKQNTELLDVDPQNRWLARQNRLRVEGEVVRDISLDVAGLLSRKIGGPSVFPSLPAGVAELSYAGNFKWTVSPGADQYRRGMYTFFKRTAPHPNLITFDCPDANLACIDRNTSNTPLQALVSLNNASFAEAARALARRMLTMSPVADDATRLTTAFRLCMARPPSEFERGQLLDLLTSSRTWYGEHVDEAHKLIDQFSVTDVSPQENAAWIATARILINLDEFITRE